MLTERAIRDAKPEGKTRILWDRQVKGFGLRITPKGAKAYILNYRVAGRERRATIGRPEHMTLKAARERAGNELSAIRSGESDPLEREREAREAPTVNDALDRYFDEYAPRRIESGRLKASSVRAYRNQSRKYLRRSLGTLKAAEVRRAHIERAVSRCPGTTRNRVLAFASRLFNLMETWEWRAQHTNPVRGIERDRETARDRVLAPSELAALSESLGKVAETHPFHVAALRVAAMTGLRIGEVLSLRWEHVSFETGRAVMPDTKTGRRTVPLAAPVLALLRDLPRVNGVDWCFPASRGNAHATYRATCKLFGTIRELAGLPDIRMHDLRRTVATGLAGSGVNAFTLRDVLGHKTLTMSNRYVRAAGDALTEATERAAAMAAAAMRGDGGEVVPMRKRME